MKQTLINILSNWWVKTLLIVFVVWQIWLLIKSIRPAKNSGYSDLPVTEIDPARMVELENIADIIYSSFNGIGVDETSLGYVYREILSQNEYNYVSNCYGQRALYLWIIPYTEKLSMKATILKFQGDSIGSILEQSEGGYVTLNWDLL